MKLEATILTTLMLLAGCIATPEEIDAASTELDSALLDELGAYSSEHSAAGDAIVLRTNATPAGGLASFWWEIPEGVLLEDDDDDRYVEFLAAPVLLEKDRAALERWVLMGFLADEGMLALNTMAFGAPFEVKGAGIMSTGSESIERSIEPFLLGAEGKLKTGGRIGFVVGGVASEDVELALVLLPLTDKWDEDEDLPEDTDAFLERVSPNPFVALPPANEGGMHQVAFYYEGGSSFGGGMTVTTGPIEHEGGTTDLVAASRRMTTISTSFDSGGYSIAAAGYEASTAAGDWAATADAHGAVSEASGTIATTFGLNVAGTPFVIAMGEGDAPATTSLALQTTSASSMGEGLFLIQIDIDTTLTDLLGLPALKIEGLTGEGAFERDGRGLAMDLAGARILAVGLP